MFLNKHITLLYTAHLYVFGKHKTRSKRRSCPRTRIQHKTCRGYTQREASRRMHYFRWRAHKLRCVAVRMPPNIKCIVQSVARSLNDVDDDDGDANKQTGPNYI